MNIPKDLFYTKDHEWARIDGDTAYIGITDYAQHSLGDITFVELPKKGEELKQSGYCATVESVKAASEVYAPLSGKVLSSNEQLAAHPELINQSAYEKGYFFSMQISSEAEKAKLMDAASYERYVEGLTK
ncbi:MAG: glycine cleavage system protein GcvH [Candidatus Omnitrophota bacterium]|nr:glycine cleavage system protein GcvH [Candidatus Omnitrophota bacterium]